MRLLCSGDIDLEPGGWRTGMALGLELKDAGYSIRESRQILLQARPTIKSRHCSKDRDEVGICIVPPGLLGHYLPLPEAACQRRPPCPEPPKRESFPGPCIE